MTAPASASRSPASSTTFATASSGTRMRSRAIAPCAALRSATRRSIRSTTGSTVPRSPARLPGGPMRRWFTPPPSPVSCGRTHIGWRWRAAYVTVALMSCCLGGPPRSAVAAGLDQGHGCVPERQPLDAVAALIAGASFVIGVDTGLVHIAAALGVPLVAIFIDSEPGLTGPMGGGPIAVVGGKRASPDPAEVLQALDRVVGRAAPTLPSPACGGG